MHQKGGELLWNPGVPKVRGLDLGVTQYRSCQRARLLPAIAGRLPLSLLLAANPALEDVAAG